MCTSPYLQYLHVIYPLYRSTVAEALHPWEWDMHPELLFSCDLECRTALRQVSISLHYIFDPLRRQSITF